MTEDIRSEVIELLEQQKYEDALPILGGLKEADPADRELQIYHLLVVRILILRWNLTGAAAKRAFFLRTKVQRIIKKGISLIRVTPETQIIPLLGRIYHAMGTWGVLRGLKSIIMVGAGIGLFLAILLFHSHDGSTVNAPAPAKMVTAILGLDSIVSASDAVPYVLDNSRTAEQASRPTPELANATGIDSLKISQPSTELPLTGTLTYGTDAKATTSGADRAAQAISYHHAPGEFAEGRQVKQTSPVKDVIGLTDIENTRDKTPRKNLGYYRSRQAIPIRTLPRFAASTLREIDSGVPLNVLAYVGSWAEVELNSGGITGFVRKEFLIPVEEDKLHVTGSLPSAKAISEVTDSTLVSRSE